MSPQSNQRGIETKTAQASRWKPTPPQSNQRGIETIFGVSFSAEAWRLNRTSVGLKHQGPPPDVGGAFGPQSNQRGIETALYDAPTPQKVTASIEPAWD